ncbi:MAG: hypothetical protein N2201_02290 [candidate division WOR-3 bacterium]|nr:hypothetical protein [candidate division WOR-3 bacterium]
MPVRTTLRRVQKFKAKYDPEVIRNAVEKQLDAIIEQQTYAQTQLEKVENLTKVILGQEGVPSPLIPAYLNFARQVWRIRNKFSAETLKIETDIALYKWVRRSLQESVLIRIRDQIFTLEAPAS